MSQHDPSGTFGPPPGEISVYTILRVVLQHRYVIAGMALAVAAGSVLDGFAGGRTYTVEASFIPQNSNRSIAGGFSALAGQLGMSIQVGYESPQFYVDLLGTRELQGRLLEDTYSVAADPRTGADADRGTLAALFEVEAVEPAERRDKTLRAVSNAIAVSATGTGIVEVAVTTPWADLSEGIGERLIELVNQFNLEIRQTQAAAETRFVEERIHELEARIRETEREFRIFLEANRQFENSPELTFEHDRLHQRVLQQRQLHAGLQESLQSASIARARDTPLITVITSPDAPAYPDSRRIPLRAILGGLLGATLGLVVAFSREFLGKAHATTDGEYGEFRRAWGETVADLLPWRRRARPDSPVQREAGNPRS